VIFIETPIFTAAVKELLDDDAYGQLQEHLVEHPDAGDVITETGGLRKLRWSAGGKGKRGGVRIIYYHVTAAFQIRLILIYKKGIKDTLTAKEKATLRKINTHWR